MKHEAYRLPPCCCDAQRLAASTAQLGLLVTFAAEALVLLISSSFCFDAVATVPAGIEP